MVHLKIQHTHCGLDVMEERKLRGHYIKRNTFYQNKRGVINSAHQQKATSSYCQPQNLLFSSPNPINSSHWHSIDQKDHTAEIQKEIYSG